MSTTGRRTQQSKARSVTTTAPGPRCHFDTCVAKAPQHSASKSTAAALCNATYMRDRHARSTPLTSALQEIKSCNHQPTTVLAAAPWGTTNTRCDSMTGCSLATQLPARQQRPSAKLSPCRNKRVLRTVLPQVFAHGDQHAQRHQSFQMQGS